MIWLAAGVLAMLPLLLRWSFRRGQRHAAALPSATKVPMVAPEAPGTVLGDRTPPLRKTATSARAGTPHSAVTDNEVRRAGPGQRWMRDDNGRLVKADGQLIGDEGQPRLWETLSGSQ